MARDAVVHRYAAALFMAARRIGALEPIEADARAIGEVLTREPRLMTFLGSPEIRGDRKEAVIRAAVGGSAQPLTLQFLQLLLRKHRIVHLAGVLEEFIERAEEARGIVSALVVTAVPIPADLAGALAGRLETMTGKKIRLKRDVNPALLGGAVVTIGDHVLDGSVRGRLNQLREDLMSARVI